MTGLSRASIVVLLMFACDPPVRERAAEAAGLPDVLTDIAHKPGEPRGMLPPNDKGTPLPELAAIGTPLDAAFCEINVEGAIKAAETDYLPRVITCENGGANFEALKAQAIAARSVVYYAMANDGQICDGQGCQVYSCGAQPQQIAYDAVKATAGQYLSYNGWLTYGFYVAGDNQQPASCVDTDNGNVSSTEKWVTFNEGQTVYNVDQTALGFQFPEDVNTNGYGQNRGCMSQWGARCLENTKAYDHVGILKFYYGEDIEILQAQGPCVEEPPPPNKPGEGVLEAADCDGIRGWAWDPDHADQAGTVYVSFNAPLGDPNASAFAVPAGEHRDDLCQALGSCAHGLTLRIPRSLSDGAPHAVHAYAIDVETDETAELQDSPREFSCPPPALPGGVRRHVTNQSVLDAWKFSTFWQMATVDAATLQKLPQWKDVEPAPQLVQVQGDPAVWIVDMGFRRRVPSPEIAAAWQLDLAAVQTVTADELMAMPQGTDLRPEPFLVQADGPEIYLIDDPQCPPGGDPLDPLCPEGAETTGGGETGTTGGETGNDSDAPTTDGQPGDPPGGSSGDDAPGPATGPALPPGYGSDEGCRMAPADATSRATGLLGLLALAAARRRRRRTAADVRKVSNSDGREDGPARG
jgi:MYXO-CTERM domain-containing protein